MSAASDLLDRLAEVGATVRSAGNDRLFVRAGANPVPAELVQHLREAKAEVLAALAPAGYSLESPDREAWWHRHFTIRTIDRQLGGYRCHREAELLAFGDMILEWHRRHGDRPYPGRCAGCDDGLPEGAGIVVDGHDVRVHFDGARCGDCIIAFGRKWRGAAVDGLKALGVDPPEGFEL